MRRGSGLLGLLLALALAATTSCSPRTLGTDTGGRTLTATFEDVRNLTVGHAVRIADVRVGTVTGIRLDGHTPRVTMQLEAGRRVPAGTTAELRLTSLLGENYVGLQLPEDYDPQRAEHLPDGASLDRTRVRPEIEEVVDEAIGVVAGIAAEDLAGIVDGLETGLGGRGRQLGELVDRVGRVTATVADQRRDLARLVDGLGRLGGDLAAGSDALGRLVDRLAAASGTLAERRQRTVRTLEELTRLARTLRRDVLEPHGQRLTATLARLEPVVATLAASRGRLQALVDSLLLFVRRIGAAVDERGRLRIFGRVAEVRPGLTTGPLPGAVPTPPGPGGGQ